MDGWMDTVCLGVICVCVCVQQRKSAQQFAIVFLYFKYLSNFMFMLTKIVFNGNKKDTQTYTQTHKHIHRHIIPPQYIYNITLNTYIYIM